MPTGILATVTVRDPAACPVVEFGRNRRVRSVTTGQPSRGRIPLEVTTDGPVERDDHPGEEVFSYDAETVYRLDRPADQGCACDCVERHDCPVRDISAEDGELLVTFIAADLAELRDVVADLRTREQSVTVRSLRQSGTDEGDSEPVFVDKQAFTDRQREVLRTAHELGYFERPKQANAGEVAAELDVCPSTFAGHLAAAQTKLMDALFEEDAAELD
ncbi:helix-turn-helix domain-containing protein [Halomicroarcula limicola]|uniref:Helix-turn-helix domain-containing protein n=1 Tax=Haloarcula limicola TaxID=1429915 RepID=A0A8J7Y314_9EURY|nr:helix-turn-helix domain-containing protein [Halomicroarcula limicola]MBV0923805.1 helix-turn-helix domain-containing protein [Halomicroarcula limicola]